MYLISFPPLPPSFRHTEIELDVFGDGIANELGLADGFLPGVREFGSKFRREASRTVSE